MNPRERKLRLRKTTIRNLDAVMASVANGGTVELNDMSALWTCTCFFCPKESLDPDMGCGGGTGSCGCPETRAYTNCIYCQSNAATCPNVGCNTEYPCLPPRQG
jgi:hypothetical protein